MTKRILILYYSQTGSVSRLIKSFTKFLDTPEVELVWEQIKPKANYPYPWKLGKFFDIFPECINGEPPEIYPPKFNNNEKFDLVILAYQVWFLAPSLPIQGFFKSEYVRVLQDTKVITLVGCRNMWHCASEIMKKMIADAGGIHIDNVVLTHQGSPLATFITTPRLLLTGKRDRAMGIFPPGGFREEDIQALSRFGKRIANNLDVLSDSSNRPLLEGLGAVSVNSKYVIPEAIGRFLYVPWAKLARLFGKQGSWTRMPIIALFAALLVIEIPIVILVATLVRIVLSPLLEPKIRDYIAALEAPYSVNYQR